MFRYANGFAISAAGRLLVALSAPLVLAGVAAGVGLLTVYSMTKIWNEAFWKAAPEGARNEPAPLSPLLIIPIVILAAFGWGYYEHRAEGLYEMAKAWILPNAITAGVFTLVAGGTSSGKTSLLSLIGCMSRPTSGQVVVDGRSLSQIDGMEIDFVQDNDMRS